MWGPGTSCTLALLGPKQLGVRSAETCGLCRSWAPVPSHGRFRCSPQWRWMPGRCARGAAVTRGASSKSNVKDQEKEELYRQRLIGFVIIVAWQVVAINLYSLDDWSKATFFVRDGSYTFLASMIYACFGLFVILLRILPRRLVMPRRLAWHVLVRYTLTRGCPEWYRPFASQTIAKWIDNSVTVFYITWASRFVCRALPWILEATSFLLPFSPGRLWSASNAQTRTLVYDTLVAFSRKLMWACLLALSALLLLNLKDPNLSAAQIPMEEQEAVKGASLFPWRPLVWLLAMRARPRLRTSNMRLLLADKCLTCAIYICLISVPLRLINVQLRTVLAVGGVGGLAVGLALQNLVQNLISGILIYTNATICEGLEVELQDVKLQGVVSEVGWFNTTVNGYEGTRVTVPNRRILDGTVIDKTNKRFRVCQKHLAAWLMGQSLGRNPAGICRVS
ncbi:Low conductance mechanosensitive channel YnaI [Durusdinium trenchii]|uniref:Low conductance mechanosensitive channel YnaI n=1 Tax=Durusdinium trenchii TaxID=1381693 RepID=A0ABP0M3W0_9DINO